MIKIALGLAGAGFKVFPLTPGTKVPMKGTKGLTEATIDTNQISFWWTQWPTANIGIAPWPDWVILDLDIKDGAALNNSIEKLNSLGLPNTFTVVTPSGGLHLYYRWPHNLYTVKSTVGTKWGFPGVDIRAQGGYVVAPGSRTTKSPRSAEGEYTIAKDLSQVAELPQGILNILPYKANSGGDYLKGLKKSVTDVTPQATTSVILPDVIPVGERDSLMYAYIGKLISQGLSKNEITTKSLEAFKRCEQPAGNPFLWSTVESQIERALSLYRQDRFMPLDAPDDLIPHQITLEESLERYCLIECGSYVADLSKDHRAEPVKWGDWQRAKSNILVAVADDAFKKLPDAWIIHQRRKIAHNITYYPKDISIMYIENVPHYNRYIPPSLKPMSTYDPAKIEIVRAHLNYLLGNSAEDLKLMERWLAYTIQRPEIKIPWAPLIITTEQGTGKGWIKDLLKILVGKTNFGLATPEMLSPNQIQFNGWMGGTLLLLDELKGINAKLLNSIVTETYGTVNPKYQPKELRDFFCNVIGFSNDLNALKISWKDRRWWIHANMVKVKSQQHYTDLYNWLKTDGLVHFYTYLWTIDTTSMDIMARPPITAAKMRMIDDTTDGISRAIKDAYELQQGPFKYDIVSTELIIEYVRNELSDDSNINERKIGKFVNTYLRQGLLPKAEQKYTITIGAKTYRKRLIIVRNPEKWESASESEVINHFKQHWKGLQ